MIRRFASFSLLVALASAAYADTGAKDVSQPEEQVEAEIETTEAAEPEALDAFVETAIQKGLLVRNQEAEGTDGEPVVGPVATAVCGGDYPLDFSVVRSLRRFTELPTSFSDVEDADPSENLRRDVKAKLALGLYSEAKAMIARQPQEEWLATRKFIELMENRTRPDVEYFRELAICHPEADVWLAAAELAVFEPEGVERISNHVATVRGLPYNLREDLYMLIVPTLLIERRRDLAQQMLATFTLEEIDNSNRLGALKTAIVDMPIGSESNDRLVMLMSRPKLKLAALLILVERSDELRPTVRSFALEEAWNVLETTETKHDLAPILEFVIDHLASGDLYAGLERVRALPVASRVEVAESIDTYTVKALNDYLADEDPANTLNALQTLSLFHTDLPLNDYGRDLRKRGATKALELGLFSMVTEFLGPVELDPEIAMMVAEAAFWSGENKALFTVRDAFPGEAEINRMAGIRALQTNAPAIAASAFGGLIEHPSTQLELLEYGALANNWTLWGTDLPALVAGLTDDEVVRLDRIRKIQTASRGPTESDGREIRPFQISGLLASSRRVLTDPQAGASNEQ